MHYQQEYIRCGKRCGSCPHGPYWYAYFRKDGKLHKRYIGKVYRVYNTHGDGPVPKTDIPPAGPGPLPKNSHWDKIFDRRSATLGLAAEILGIDVMAACQEWKRAYRRLVSQLHPDKGGEKIACQRVVAAYTFYQSGR